MRTYKVTFLDEVGNFIKEQTFNVSSLTELLDYAGMYIMYEKTAILMTMELVDGLD